MFKVPGKKDLYIALGDRWLPEYMDVSYEACRDGFAAAFNSEAGADERAAHPIPQAVYRTQIADYVWLPILFEDGVPRIRWYDSWKVEDFE